MCVLAVCLRRPVSTPLAGSARRYEPQELHVRSARRLERPFLTVSDETWTLSVPGRYEPQESYVRSALMLSDEACTPMSYTLNPNSPRTLSMHPPMSAKER